MGTRTSGPPPVAAERPSRGLGWAVACGLACWLVSPSAKADSVLAETLFQSGRAALAAGDLDSACPKLGESHRLDPAGGTALLWGLCLEKQGKHASAWAALEDALSYALREKNTERTDIARRHLAAVEPRLVRVSLHLDGPARAPRDLVVRRDGLVVPPSALDTPTPLDAGEHVITAEATGFARFEQTFVVPAEPSAAAPTRAHEVRITLVPLAAPPASVGPVAEAPPSPRAPEPLPPTSKIPRATPWIVAGTGGAVLAVGAFFGLRASDRMDEVRTRCPRSPCTDRGAQSLRNDAGRDADRATVALIAGGVLVGGGLSWGLLRSDGATTVRVGGRF